MTSTTPTPGSRILLLVGASALLVQALTVPLEVLAMLASPIPYDPIRQTISDLAATTCTDIPYPAGPVAVCSPLHDALGLSGVLAGALLLVAAVSLPSTAMDDRGSVAAAPARPGPAGARAASRAPRRGIAVAARGLLGVMGLSTVATALIPLDVDLDLHTLVSIPVILVGPAAWALAVDAWGRPSRGGRTAMWALAALATLCGLIVLGTLDAWGLMGLFERAAVWLPIIGLAVVGADLLRRRHRVARP